ncbi:MAG: alkyl sulfatase dimerization domain-containing protein, partial [Nakamurella sp.]
EFLSAQRDLYGYLHDQTLRMINQGYTGSEIAERIVLPPALEQTWSARGYYGSVSHNVKAIYQRYMGWFDGNPSRLWQHPPVEAAKRHVDYMGGAEEVLRRAQQSFDDGDYRWVAQVLDYVIFADPDNAAAKTMQADTLEQLGYGSENGTWRNFFLTGAYELRYGSVGTPITANAPDLAGALTLQQIFDTIALRIDGPKAWDTTITIDWQLTDLDVLYRSALANGVLVHYALSGNDHPAPDATFTLTRPQLLGVIGGAVSLPDALKAGQVKVTGDPASFGRLAALLDSPDPNFAIVTP